MPQTVGQLLISESLPEDLRDPNMVLDKKGVNELFRKVAQLHPEQYRDISKKLADLGHKSSQEQGGYSFGIKHLHTSPAAHSIRARLRPQIQSLLDNDLLDDKTREERIIRIVGSKLKDQQEAVFNESRDTENPLAGQVISGSRGNKMNLTSLRGSDLLYVDHRDHTIPVPVLSSYSEGLKPWEYWAGTYGARKGIVDLKTATMDAGYLGKQLNQITHRLVVTGLDAPPSDDKSPRGLPVATDDKDNEGALLAQAVGPYKQNTVLNPKIQKHLTQLGKKRILVRSPTVGGSPDGGVYSRDVGVREHGNLPGIGEFPGMTAAQAISEPLTQASISSKHQGGVAGEGKAISGFDYIDQLVQIPKHFKHGATHSEEDGVVGKITDAPAGGNYIYINGKEHYTPIDAKMRVKLGDRVEAGDAITDGMPNPSKIVQHKGVGEGRRYFVGAFKDAMNSAGIPVHRRNIELLSRGLINHVRLTGEIGDFVPDDIVPYHQIEHSYKPRKDAREMEPAAARDKYLEKPVLHYTIGTRIRPSVQKDLEDFGVKKVHAHDEPPAFQSEMVRGMSNLTNDPDWLTRMYGSGLKGGLLKGVHRGSTSDEKGTSFVPSIAKSVDFGRIPDAAVRSPLPGFEVKSADNYLSFGDGSNPAKMVNQKLNGSSSATVKPETQTASQQTSAPTTSPKPAATPLTQNSTPSSSGGQNVHLPGPSDDEPTPQSNLWFGGYQGNSGPQQQLAQMALPYANQLGAAAPLAIVGGLDWNALGTLTRGGNKSLGSTVAPEQTPTAVQQSTTPAIDTTYAATVTPRLSAGSSSISDVPAVSRDVSPGGAAESVSSKLGLRGNVARLVGDEILDPVSSYHASGRLPGIVGGGKGYLSTIGSKLKQVGPSIRSTISEAPTAISDAVKSGPQTLANFAKSAPGAIADFAKAAPGAIASVAKATPAAVGRGALWGIAKGVRAGGNYLRYTPGAAAMSTPVSMLSNAAYYGSDEGGGGYGAARDTLSDYRHPVMSTFKFLGDPVGKSLQWAEGLGNMHQLSAHANPNTPMGATASTANLAAGINPDAQVEARRLSQDSKSMLGDYYQQSERLRGIREQDPAQAHTQTEAESYAAVQDPERTNIIRQQLAARSQQQPDQKWQVDWTQRRPDGGYGVIYSAGSAQESIANNPSKWPTLAQLGMDR